MLKILVRLAVVLAVVAGFLYLFLRSAQNVRSEPYVVERQHLQSWSLALETPRLSTSPMLVVRPPTQFGNGLFKQVFARMMESMKGSSGDGVPVILRGEYERALAGRYTPQGLLEAARAAGLESAPFTPRCVAFRRVSEPGLTRQAYFVVFDWPAFVRFRGQIAAEAAEAAPPTAAFEANSLSPIMMIASSDADAERWLPIGAGADADCVAPIAIE